MHTTPPPYLLSKQAYVCATSEALFLLDLRTGKYLSLDRHTAASLGSLIQAWPVESQGSAPPKIVQSLIQRGLITPDPKLGKPATPLTNELPTLWIREGEPRGRPNITLHTFVRFVLSVSHAVWSKRFVSFESMVKKVRRAKHNAIRQTVSVREVASLVRAFDWLRPLGFRKTDQCFLYCLALGNFLARHGVYSSWVFAIRSDPFVAHCWLQYQDQVLTDIPFNLRQMTPILVL